MEITTLKTRPVRSYSPSMALPARLEASAQKAQDLDNEQEALKSKLTAQTAALNANRDELTALLAEAKKLIKLDLPKTDWKQFGIADAR